MVGRIADDADIGWGRGVVAGDSLGLGGRGLGEPLAVVIGFFPLESLLIPRT